MSQLQVTGEAKIRDIQGPVVANSGVITALDGAASQYVRGDGTLADFPTSTGGGSSVSYYLNSSVSQGTIDGNAYRELSKDPIIGTGTDIAISSNGYVANYITDANDPDVVIVPGGNFNCEFYFSVNNNTGSPTTYAELYKYDGSTFTLLGSSSGVPESINQGTTIAPYYFAIPVATATLATTDRLAIRIYVNVDGRTVTLHTENSHLCQVVTTLSKGMVSLNNLTDQSQYLTTGTSGTNFAIVSSGDTHTFNLPVASATNTGKLSSTDWTTFNNKQNAITDPITGTGTSTGVAYFDSGTSITSEATFNYDASTNRLGVNTSVPNATIGANAGTDSGYSLLLKNDNANYNGIGFGTDSTYGNLISTEKQGTALTRNLTLLNQSGFVSLTEAGNLGLGLLTPNTGLDIYNGTSAYLWLHTATSGTGGTDGVRLALFNTNGANLRNFEGSFSITAEGDFSVITLGAENFRINSADGSIYQSKVSDAMLKTVSGVLTAAVAGTDYVAPSALADYVTLSTTQTITGIKTFNLSPKNETGIQLKNDIGIVPVVSGYTNLNGLTNGLAITNSSGVSNNLLVPATVGYSYTFPASTGTIALTSDLSGYISGSGASGRIPYFNGTSSVTSEAAFNYDSSTNRLGVNTNTPNATIGANAGTDSGYSLLLKNADTNYNGIGFGTDSTYGNLISTEKLGTATAKNITILNQSGFVSLTEGGNLGLNILNPAVAGAGIDIYSSTSAGLRFHTATSGTTVSDGAGINFSSANNLGITNYEAGAIDIVTNGNSGVYINQLGYVGINGATPSSELTVNGNAAISGLTTGQIVFPTTGGLLIGSSSLFWDNTNGRLAVGTNNTSTGRKLTIYSASADTHLAILGVAPSVRFADNFTATYSALFGMATASNNYVTGAVAGDFVITYNSANNLIFGNSNTSLEKMRINSSGNLLINTTTDNGANLNVNGVIYGTRARLNNSYDNASVSLNVGGQTYMDSRTSRLYQTYNLSSMSNYMHIYDPYSSVNANGGFSIGASSSITTLPSTSIIHFDGVNNRVGIGTTAPSYTLDVNGTGRFSGMLTISGVAEYLRSIQSGTSSQAQTWYAADGTTRRAVFGFRSASSDNFTLLNERNGSLLIGTNDATNLTIASTGAATFSSSVGIGGVSATSVGGTAFMVYDSATPRIRLTNSTTGTTSTDGSELSLFNSDFNIENREAGAMNFYVNGGLRQTITSGGNVGIGTSDVVSTSLTGALTIKKSYNGDSTNGSTTQDYYLNQSGLYLFGRNSTMSLISNNGEEGEIIFGNNNNRAYARIATGSGTSSLGGDMYFKVGNSTERMRITSGGNVLIGTTTDSGYKSYIVQSSDREGLTVECNNASFTYSALLVKTAKTTTSGSYRFTTFNNGTSDKFYVLDSGSAYNTTGTYGTISDATLKENIIDATPKLADLMQLKVRNFNMIGDETKQIGFIAQEMEEVFPAMIDIDGKSGKKAIKTSVLVPMLVKAIQEQQAQIEELKALIAAK